MSISAQAAAGAAQAFAAAGDALTTATVRLVPTKGAYDPATDSTPITWEQDTDDVSCLAYDDVIEEARRVRSFIFLGTSITATNPGAGGIIIEGGVNHEIYAVESDPTKAIWIFHCLK